MLKIKPLRKGDLNKVLSIQASAEQFAFSADPKSFIEAHVQGSYPFLIWESEQIIGYFKLDTLLPQKQNYCPVNSLGLCTLLVDKRMQGKGVGTQSVLHAIEYVKTHFKQYDYLYLTVNCKNPAAYHCYLKAGFEDTGELYLGGPVGPQHIMKISLH